MPIACLPWYAMPETEAAEAALWLVIARHLSEAGIEAPASLTRDVPVPRIFTDPDLLLAQCCGYDVVYGFAGSVMPLATPVYNASGCEGPTYRSFVLVREDCLAARVADLRGATAAVNGLNSHSGANALRGIVAGLAEGGRFFGAVRLTGAHRASLGLLRSGEADVMAMDCVLHALLAVHRPSALCGTRVLAASESAPAPPLVTSAAAGQGRAERMRMALLGAMADPDSAAARAELLIERIEVLPRSAYQRIVDIEAGALRHDYFELHATSPLLGPILG
jgi:ABC-type phosphate/phosphonate transport system substrate-binding protein